MSKVKLPKDVADAIDHLRKITTTNTDIMWLVLECHVNPLAYRVHKWANTEGTKDKLMEALVYGYEPEKTPEEQLRQYYERVRENGEDARYAGLDWTASRSTARLDGIKQTLHILGIKVEGINA